MKLIRLTLEEFIVEDDYSLTRTGDIVKNERMVLPIDKDFEKEIKIIMLDEVKREIDKKVY